MTRILVIRFSAMGDVAMTLPIIRLILNENPTIEITFLTRENFSPLFENIDRLKVIGIDFSNNYNKCLGLKKLHRELSINNKFDAIIDLHDVLRTKILRSYFKFSGTKVFTIDKDRWAKRKMIRTKILQPLPHSTTRYLNVFKKAGIFANENNIIFPSIVFSEKDKNTTNEFLSNYQQPFIAFAPFAKHASKTLPLNKSEQLIKKLSEKYTVFLLGGNENIQQFDEWVNTHSNVYNTTSLQLTQQALLMLSMKAVVSMDSANMHLAAIQGVPVVSIWGATHPYFGFSGINTNSISWVSTKEKLYCRPCSVFGNKSCINKKEPYACLNQIDIADIMEAIALI
jgi:ADP-heptose:LPS heptosyltransferase